MIPDRLHSVKHLRGQFGKLRDFPRSLFAALTRSLFATIIGSGHYVEVAILELSVLNGFHSFCSDVCWHLFFSVARRIFILWSMFHLTGDNRVWK